MATETRFWSVQNTTVFVHARKMNIDGLLVMSSMHM